MKLLVPVIIVCSLLNSIVAGSDGSASDAPFQIQQAKEGWTRLREAVNGISMTYTETTTVAKSSQPPIVIEHEFCVFLDKGYARNTRKRLDRPELTDVELENPAYAFRVRKRTVDSAYSMTLYDGVKPGKTYEMDAADTRFNLGYLISGYYMEPFNLFEVTSRPDFKLTGSKTVELSGLKCVEVEWTWTPEKIPNGSQWTAVLSPQEDWAIRECTMLHPQGDTHIEIQYQKTKQGYFLPKQIVEEHRFHRGAVASTKLVEFGAPSECVADLSEFRATAYGLPEPGSGFSGLLIGGLVASFVAILALIYYRKK